MINYTCFKNNAYGLKHKMVPPGVEFSVCRVATFAEFVTDMMQSNTVMPFVPRNKKISHGYISSRDKTYPVYSSSGESIGVVLRRTSELFKNTSGLLYIDFDMHLLMEVFYTLMHRYNLKPPKHYTPSIDRISGANSLSGEDGLPYVDENTIKDILLMAGLDIHRHNHLIYKSTSYGKEITDKTDKTDMFSTHKTNMHCWFELHSAVSVDRLAKIVERMFSFIPNIKGVDRQSRIQTKPYMPDYAVYSSVRLMFQGELTDDRIISVKTDGAKLPQLSYLTKKTKLHETPLIELYEDIGRFSKNVDTYNMFSDKHMTSEEFAQYMKHREHRMATRQLYLDDMVYIDNKPKATYAEMRDTLKESYTNKNTSLFVERAEDITLNISDINDPLSGKKDNCYLVIKPDDSMKVCHFSEGVWYSVINKPRAHKTITIDRYIPTQTWLTKIHKTSYALKSPTGTGKTYYMIQIALSLLCNDKSTKIVWTVPDYAALYSIAEEVKKQIDKQTKFIALTASKHKWVDYEENDFILVTPDKLQGDMLKYTKHLATSSPMLIPMHGGRIYDYDFSKWTFIIDEVHNVFMNADSKVNQFMFYRIINREVNFDNLIVMSADLPLDYLPNQHEIGHLKPKYTMSESNTQNDTNCVPGTNTHKHIDFIIDEYTLKTPRAVTVQHNFPWREILNSDKALVLSPTPNKAIGVYQELKDNKPHANIQLYLGLPRNAGETSVQTYKKDDGTLVEYTRPSHDELENADFVVATALTAGTSLSTAFDYAVVDMVGSPHQLINAVVEVQKLSRARHSAVKRVLVIPETRFDNRVQIPKLRLTDPATEMNAVDYMLSRHLGVNRHLTDVLSIQPQAPQEEIEILEVKTEISHLNPAYKKHLPDAHARQIKTGKPPIPTTAFDILRSITTHYMATIRDAVRVKSRYTTTHDGFEHFYIKTPVVDCGGLGKEHIELVKQIKKWCKTTTYSNFEKFMSSPPTRLHPDIMKCEPFKDLNHLNLKTAIDKVQQDYRKVVIPESPTCDPRLGLLPKEYIEHPELVPHLKWTKSFTQLMKQNPQIAAKAITQNNLFCRADSKFVLNALDPDTYYPINKLRTLLGSLIKQQKTKKAMESMRRDPRKALEKLGRVTYFRITRSEQTKTSTVDCVLTTTTRHTFEQLTRYNAKKTTHLCFKLGWFDLDDLSIVESGTNIDTPNLDTHEENKNKSLFKQTLI